MFETSMIINSIYVVEDKLNISLSITCPYDNTVTSPKAKLFFECNGKTRRLPLKLDNYYRQKRTDKCTATYSYTIFMDEVYFNFDCDSPLTVRIDFYYGDNEVLSVPFKLTRNSASKAILQNIDKIHIVKQRDDGMDSFDETVIPPLAKADYKYNFEFDFNTNSIVFTKNPYYKDKNKTNPFFALIKFIMFVLRVAVTLLISPYLVLDGFFAGLGIIPKRNTKYIDSVAKNIFVQIKINASTMLKTSFKRKTVFKNLVKPFVDLSKFYYKILCKKPVVQNRVTFMSCRRSELSGNPKFVYDIIKDNKDIDFQFFLYSDANGHRNPKNVLKFLKLYASSKVVIIDDYFRLTNLVTKRDDVKLFQLWHACGAFKTFGFSRLGKRGGPKQTDPNHRMYDYAIVSSKEIEKHYAEGFGLSDECVVATGVPRTDIFMDADYSAKVKAQFYDKHPQLKDKKILLFAPTFRGDGQISAYFPLKAFNPNKLYEKIGNEYAIIIKLHPFCKQRFNIKDEYKDYIIDLSDEDELNDLLFVTDLLVTDYSSVVFEASLLDIPMLFYSYDVQEYISTRDFYYDYEGFVPGKIVLTQKALTDSIVNKDFEFDKVDSFKHKFFDDIDGKSSQRVADLVLKTLND